VAVAPGALFGFERSVALVDCVRSANLLPLRIATAAVLLILFIESY